jgi:hypothetical protein
LQTRNDSIPWQGPYIFAERARIERWAEHLGSDGFKIGIVWQGNPASAVEEGRSFPVSCYHGIAQIPGSRLISLQKNAGVEQLFDLPAGMQVETLGSTFDAGDQAFLDTAAVIANLDLVITCDTSIAHLAGAMGRPVWIALRFLPDWRWQLHRADSPWYPSARLFRQSAPNDWRGVFETISKAVTEYRAGRR